MQNLSVDSFPHLREPVAKIISLIGEEHVVLRGGSFDIRAKDTIPRVQRPAAFVFPGSVEDVQAIVKIANEFNMTLWPVSKGKNWGYGGATAVREEAIVMSLERMNHILEVNEELAFATIEPGVTYDQLNQYLKKNHPSLWSDTTDSTPAGSVIGNAMEKGLGETPYGDHFGNLCGMEVVLPTGDLIRTGGGHATRSKTWNTHKWGTGPYLEGLFTQSNFGIVTKAGLWLMPAPDCFSSAYFEIATAEHLAPAVDALRRLALKGIIQSKIHAGNDWVLLALMHPYYRQDADQPEALTSATAAEQRKRFGIPAWTFNWGLYGGAKEVSIWKSMIRRELRPFGAIRFMSDGMIDIARRFADFQLKLLPSSSLRKVSTRLFRLIFGKSIEFAQIAPHQHGLLKGIPTEFFLRYAYWKSPGRVPECDVNPARDNCGEMWHAPVIPFTGTDLTTILDACRPCFEEYGFEFCVTMLLINPRSVVTLFGIFYSKENSDEKNRAEALCKTLFEKTAALGYSPYRTSVASTSEVLDVNPGFKALANQLKAAIDPKHVLSPGRYGIGS